MRLIDADAVAEAIKDEITEAKGIDADPNFTAGLKLGLAYINTAPTIDAEPSRHGKWLHPEEDDEDYHTVSCPVNPETNTFDGEVEAIEAWNHSYDVPKVTCDWR